MEQIRLDLIPGKSAPVCHASQYDVGRTIRLNLVEGGSEYSIPAGTSAEIHIRKPDNNIISATVTATQGNKYIDIETEEQWTACAGTNLCEIVLTNGGNVIGTINFILEVEMDPIDGGSASESVIYNIQALVDTAVALHTFLIHITETTMTESAADILDAISSNKILQVIYKPDANSLTTHILPLTLDSGARPDGIRALAFASFWDSKLYAADIVLDSLHSIVTSVSTINGKDLDETGDFPIHIHNSTITETAGEVLDAMADGLKPYVIWTNSSQSNYTFTYVLAAVWNPDANTETLIFGCPITGAVRTIHVFIDPTARTYRSSIQIIDYSIPQINDATTSSSSVWSSQKTASELAGKAEIDDTTTDTDTTWSSSRIVSLLPTESASGAVASFETPLTLPLVSHNVTLEPVQAGTGDPSPSNVRPISGHSSVTVSHSGADTSDPTTYTRTFLDSNDDPVTVYGGSENLKTGEGIIKKGIGTFPTITEYAEDLSGHHYTSVYVGGMETAQGKKQDIIAETVKADGSLGDKFAVYRINKQVVVGVPDNYTVEDYNTNIAGTKFAYPLATPQTFHTDSLNLDTLEGVNNIWADTGDTAVEYKQDIQTYIDNRLSSGTRSLSLAKAPIETKEDTKQEEQEGDEPSEG